MIATEANRTVACPICRKPYPVYQHYSGDQTACRGCQVKARKRKADRAGYHPDDEFFYSLYQIERLLPYAVDPYATPPPTLADELMINRKHAGKAEGYGGWEAAIADIRKAIQQTSTTRAEAIQQFLGGPSPYV